jgi:hypothetical protein
MVKVWRLWSTPPFAVPPLSESRTLPWRTPFAFGAEVYVSVPIRRHAWLRREQRVVVVGRGERERCHSRPAAPRSWSSPTPETTTARPRLPARLIAPFVKVGASLTAVTVMMKVCVGLRQRPPFAVPPSILRLQRDRRRPVGIRGRCIGQGAVRRHRRPRREQTRFVFAAIRSSPPVRSR